MHNTIMPVWKFHIFGVSTLNFMAQHVLAGISHKNDSWTTFFLPPHFELNCRIAHSCIARAQRSIVVEIHKVYIFSQKRDAMMHKIIFNFLSNFIFSREFSSLPSADKWTELKLCKFLSHPAAIVNWVRKEFIAPKGRKFFPRYLIGWSLSFAPKLQCWLSVENFPIHEFKFFSSNEFSSYLNRYT